MMDGGVREAEASLSEGGTRRVGFHVEESDDRLTAILIATPLDRPADVVIKKRTVQVEITDPDVCVRIAKVRRWQGPSAPFEQRAQDVFDVRDEAVDEALWENLRPFAAQERVRNLPASDLRRRLATDIPKGVARRPQAHGRQFTDLWPSSVLSLLDEAEKLVGLFWKNQQAPLDFPLLPEELAWLSAPPERRRGRTKRRDYEDALRYDPELIREPAVLANDLMLLRLGYDPRDKQARTVLRKERERAGSR